MSEENEVVSEEKEVPVTGNDDWQKVPGDNEEEFEDDIFKFDEIGQVLEGKYDGFKSNVGENNSNLYSIILEDESIAKLWGSKVLDSRMSKIQVGTQIKIEWLGKKKSESGGRSYHTYDVYTK